MTHKLQSLDPHSYCNTKTALTTFLSTKIKSVNLSVSCYNMTNSKYTIPAYYSSEQLSWGDSGMLARVRRHFPLTIRLRAQTMDKQSSYSESASSESDSQRAPESGSGPGGGDSSAKEEVESSLPLDQVFEILKNKRRRETLHYLRDNDGQATLSDLAEHIAAIENDTTVKLITSSQRKRVYVGLYQCHLPKMDDMDVIDFDQNRGTIAAGENMDQLEPYLHDDQSRAWHWAYLLVAAAGVGLFAVSQLGAAQFGLTPSVILGILLVSVTGCAVAQAGFLALPFFTQ
jgi:hypothetical protein